MNIDKEALQDYKNLVIVVLLIIMCILYGVKAVQFKELVKIYCKEVEGTEQYRVGLFSADCIRDTPKINIDTSIFGVNSTVEG